MDKMLISVSNAALAIGETARTVRRKIDSGRIPATSNPEKLRGGRSGITYLIDTRDLSPEAQLRFQAMHEGGAELTANLAGYKAKRGEAALAELMKKLDAVKELALYKAQGRRDLMAQRARLAKELGMSPSRLAQLQKAYAEQGLQGLMGAQVRADKGRPRTMCMMAEDYILAEYCAASKVTQNVVYRNLVNLAKDLGEKACAICPHNPASLYRAALIRDGKMSADAPSCDQTAELPDGSVDGKAAREGVWTGIVVPDNRCAVNRYIQTIPPGVRDMGRMGGRYWEARYMPKCLRTKPVDTNEVWYGDHHVFDVFVLHEGKPVRPWLTAWMDARSGCFVGWELSLNPNSHTIVESLGLATLHTMDSPFYGLPMMLYIDNGKDYRCKRIEGDGLRGYELGKLNVECTANNALLKTLGIGVTRAIPYRAWSKTIERAFGILETQWIRQIPGWCGNGIDAKPESLSADIRAGKLWTYEEFAAYWANVILPEYHNYVPADDKERKSPLEIYQSSEKARGGETPSPALVGVASQLRMERKVHTQGIHFYGRTFAAAALDPYIGQYVQVLYNTKEDAILTVLDRDGRYICAAVTATCFDLVGEDTERLNAHLERQYAAKRAARAALQLPRDRVRMLGTLVSEIPDLAYGSEITSLVHEAAYRGKEDAKDRIRQERGGRTAAERAAGSRIQRQLQSLGAELLEKTGNS